MVIVMEKSIIYLDLIVLANTMINFIFLFFIQKIFSKKVNYINLFFTALVGGLMIIPAFYSYLYLKIMKIIGGLLIGLILSNTFEKTQKVIKISLFYTLNFSFIGILMSFKISEWYVLICAIIVILIMICLENYRKYHIFLKDCEYNVIIKSDKNVINIKGFLDTGNSSSHQGIPLVFINHKYKIDTNKLKKYLINIETVNGVKIIEGFLYKDLVIEANHRKCYKDAIIVFSDISVDCLLNPMLLL